MRIGMKRMRFPVQCRAIPSVIVMPRRGDQDPRVLLKGTAGHAVDQSRVWESGVFLSRFYLYRSELCIFVSFPDTHLRLTVPPLYFPSERRCGMTTGNHVDRRG